MSISEKLINLNDFQINYAEAGLDVGIPIIFLHNGGGFWQSWEKQLNYFSKHFKVFALDWPSCGKSENPGKPLNQAINVSALSRFVEEKNFTRVNLIGNCIGGSAAIEYAIKYPEKINKLIILNICPGDLLFPKVFNKKFIKSLKSKEKATKRIEKIINVLYSKFILNIMFPKMLFGKNFTQIDPLFVKYKKRLHTRQQEIARTDMIFHAHSYNLSPIIENKIIPKHILIWGKENAVASCQKHGHSHYKMLNSNQFHEIEGAGHLCMYEKPNQINSIINKYLNDE